MSIREDFTKRKVEGGKSRRAVENNETMQWFHDCDVTRHHNTTDTMVKKLLTNSNKSFDTLDDIQPCAEYKRRRSNDKVERLMDRLSISPRISPSSSSSSSSEIDDIIDSSDDMMRLLRRDITNLTSSMRLQTKEIDKLSTDVNSIQRVLTVQKKSAKILDMQQSAMEQMNWVLGAETELDFTLHGHRAN